jgi:hypothetical protein
MEKNTKKVIAAIVGGLVLGGALTGAVGYLSQPEPLDVASLQAASFNEGVASVALPDVEAVASEAYLEGVNSVVIPEAVEDVEFLKVACDRLMFEDLEECKEEVNAEDAALALAWEAVSADGFDMLEDKSLFKDEDDLEFVKLYTDFEDINVVKSDFDDDEYKFQLEAKVEDVRREVKKVVVFTVEVEDGESKLKNVKLA